MKKRLLDSLSLVLLVVVILFFLYHKGYIFTNFETLHVNQAYELLQQHPDEVFLLDVRSQNEYLNDGRIAKSKLIPLGVLEQNIATLPKDKTILVYCRSGNRSVSASRILADHGFKVYNIDGGMREWKARGLPAL
ncbi:MAG: rhodanese-like domain-containing protein [Sulfurimonas sp.]|nr:MAG: rhodanese-like domain-containing protein [Sulfurimonas sp.]